MNVDELDERPGLHQLFGKMRVLDVESLAGGRERVPVEVVAPQVDIVHIQLISDAKHRRPGRMQPGRDARTVQRVQPVRAAQNPVRHARGSRHALPDHLRK